MERCHPIHGSDESVTGRTTNSPVGCACLLQRVARRQQRHRACKDSARTSRQQQNAGVHAPAPRRPFPAETHAAKTCAATGAASRFRADPPRELSGSGTRRRVSRSLVPNADADPPPPPAPFLCCFSLARLASPHPQ